MVPLSDRPRTQQTPMFPKHQVYETITIGQGEGVCIDCVEVLSVYWPTSGNALLAVAGQVFSVKHKLPWPTVTRHTSCRSVFHFLPMSDGLLLPLGPWFGRTDDAVTQS